VADFLLEQTRRVCRDAVARAAPNARRPGDEAAPPRRPSLADPALHEDERRALELAVRGTTYKVIAQRLGEPEDVVMGWLTSGLKKLSE
jgi:DNA-directed RNA polymerase specialized sigma24 family protein